jgi:ribosome-associated toxin RatA of RatAB toxin-antitoxin module
MNIYKYEIILNYDIKKIFTILENLSIYKELLPHLKTLKILKKTEKEENILEYDAYIELSYLLVRLNYNCKIIYDRNKYQIDIHGFGGSFKFINASWILEEIKEDQTKISYKIEFELNCSIQQKIARKIFEFNSDRIRRKLICALQTKLK